MALEISIQFTSCYSFLTPKYFTQKKCESIIHPDFEFKADEK